MKRLDELHEEIVQELDKINGPERLNEALDIAASVLKYMIDSANPAYQQHTRAIIWDGIAHMMLLSSNVSIKGERTSKA